MAKPQDSYFPLALMLFLGLSACGPSFSQAELQQTATQEAANRAEYHAAQTVAAYTPTPIPGAESIPTSLVWTRQFGTSLTDEIGDVVVDQSGNVYLTCLCSLGSPQPSDNPFVPSGGRIIGRIPTLMKFDAEGNLAWDRGLDISSFDPWAPLVAVDAVGNVIMVVSGSKENESYTLVVKFDAEGTELWRERLPDYWISDVATGPGGSIFVVGRSHLEPNTMPKTFLRKYDTQGNELWTRLLDPSGSFINGLTAKVIIGLDGHPNVMGSIEGEFPSAISLGGEDIFIQNYTPQGNEKWTRQFGSDQDDFIEDATVDSAGNIYFVYNNEQPVLEKYDMSGVQLWTQRLGKPGTKWVRLATDHENLYILLNHNWPYDPLDAQVWKLDAAGNETWIRSFPVAWPAGPELIATDRKGSVYVGGETEGALPGQTDSGSGDIFLFMMGP